MIVFDGYGTSSTKDMTQSRRNKGITGVEVSFDENMNLHTSKDLFLSNSKNKMKFIQMLGRNLSAEGCDVTYSIADTDTNICFKSIEAARTKTVKVIGDDTDLLVLLLYHFEDKSKNIIFMPQQTSRKAKIWSLCDISLQLPSLIKENIIFVHALMGCNTTSCLQGLGKVLGLKKLQSSKKFSDIARIFNEPNQNQETVILWGEEALLILYNGKDEVSLNELRHKRFIDKISVRLNTVNPSALPPTSSAVKFHNFRVYLQVQQWKNTVCMLDPEEWGWKKSGDILIPITMDIPAAPQELLKVIRCTCKTDCSNRTCTCRKYSRDCSIACLNCRGTACSNSEPIISGHLPGED